MRLKHKFFVLSTVFLLMTSPGNSGETGFAYSINSDVETRVNGMTTDSAGNIYIVGLLYGSADFDLGTGVSNLSTSGNNRRAYVAKYTAQGSLIWAKAVLDSSNPFANAIAVDSSQNVFITGSFSGNSQFDPDGTPTNLSSNGFGDVFVAKLNSNGSLNWVKSVGGADNDEGSSIALDGSGNVHTTGYFGQGVDFDPGAGTSTLNSIGGSDVFILKLDSSGTYIWAKNVGGSPNDTGSCVAVDSNSNVYIAGNYSASASVDFDPGAGTFMLPGGGGFLLKLDSTGAFIWAKNLTGNAYFVTTDNASVYTSATDGIEKRQSDGTLVWNIQVPAPCFTNTIDSSGNVYVAGILTGSAFGLPYDNPDGFIAKIKSNGTAEFARKFKAAGANSTSILGIRVDTAGIIYTAGHFLVSSQIDTGAGAVTLTALNQASAFVSRFIPAPVASSIAATTHFNTPTDIQLSGTNVAGNQVALTYNVLNPSNGVIAGTAPNLIYTPNAGFLGTDSFTYTVNDGVYESGSATVSINVTNVAPSVIVSASPVAAATGETVTFVGSGTDSDADILSYSWNFGDSGTSTDQNAIHSYAEAGSYISTVTVTDPAGAIATASILIVVSKAPTVRITTDDVVGFASLPLVFDATLSTDPENQIASYSWDFGDGSPLGSQQIMSKIYDQPGTYTVTLTVTDAAGVSSSLQRIIEVLPADQAGLFNGFVSYKVRWDRDKESKDTLQLTAQVNVGEQVVGAGTLVALDIVGQHFEGTLDLKLRDKTDPDDVWQVKANLRKQPAGTVLLKVKIKNADLGLGFNQAGAVKGADPSDIVDADIPVRITVGGRSFELNVASEFRFNSSGKRAKGEGDE